VKVRVSHRAQREADRHDAWWRANRTGSPDLFIRELLQILEVLGSNPDVGVVYDAKRFSGPVRRVLMKKTERHVYYGRLGDEVIVLAVWGGRRGHGPKP
jgi:plasmid stabilization system protein ParE